MKEEQESMKKEQEGMKEHMKTISRLMESLGRKGKRRHSKINSDKFLSVSKCFVKFSIA